MDQKLACDTVRDLLPVYIEHMTSETSDRSIEEHLEQCGECREVLKSMKEPVEAEKAPEVLEFGKYLKKSRLSILYWIMGAAAAIALATCFIVNLAVDQRLTWFYIVAGGIFTAYLPAYVWIFTQKHRFIKALGMLELCTLLLLGIIQLVVYHILGIGGVWIGSIGLPVLLIWSAIIWSGVAVYAVFRFTVVNSLSVVFFLSIGGNYLTNFICNGYKNTAGSLENFIENTLGFCSAAVLLLIIGLLQAKGLRRRTPDGL